MTPFEHGYLTFMKLAYHGAPSGDPWVDVMDTDDFEKSKQHTREDVAYHDSSPHPGEECSQCEYYQSDGTCRLVMGKINPNGLCDLYSPA